MNLLLLLSALLSAITGVGAGAGRVPVAAEQVVAAAQARTTVASARIAATLPAQAVDRLSAMLADAPLVRIALDRPPLYASRRRE